jgi:hypothetical protein
MPWFCHHIGAVAAGIQVVMCVEVGFLSCNWPSLCHIGAVAGFLSCNWPSLCHIGAVAVGIQIPICVEVGFISYRGAWVWICGGLCCFRWLIVLESHTTGGTIRYCFHTNSGILGQPFPRMEVNTRNPIHPYGQWLIQVITLFKDGCSI